jgi:RHS repeat-associated protein
MGADHFSIRWRGYVQPRFSETHTFTVAHDEGIRLSVNDQLIIDALSTVGTHSGTIALAAGVRYGIRLDYNELGYGAFVRLDWYSASQGYEVVPQSQLFPYSEATSTPTLSPTPTRTPTRTSTSTPTPGATPSAPSGQEWRFYYRGASPERSGGDFAGTQRVAMRVQGDPNPSNNGVFYFLTDHLGSTTVTVNSSGNPVGELRYQAFGATRFASGEPGTEYRYTGQRELSEIGLYFYRARWFDPALARFVQADTIVPGATNPQAWDRYSYVRNNPLRYVDPTGLRACDDFDASGRCYTAPPAPRPTEQAPTPVDESRYVSLRRTEASRNDAVSAAAGEVTLEEWSGSGGIVGWVNFGDRPWTTVEDDYFSAQPNYFGEVPEAPPDRAGGFVNMLGPFAEANYRASLANAPGVGNVLAIAYYSYSSQGLWISSSTVENQSGLLVGASIAFDTILGPGYQSDWLPVPAGDLVQLYPSAVIVDGPGVYPPYETVELTISLIGYVRDNGMPYLGRVEFYFPAAATGDMPYWSNR